MTNKNNIIDEILKVHGKRKQPDDLMKKRAMNNVKSHWQTNIQKRKNILQNHFVRFAATVFIFVSAGIFLKYAEFSNTKAIFAKDQFTQGEVLYSVDGNNWKKSDQNYIVQSSWLKTNKDSFANISLIDNSQLRINQNSIVEFVSLNEIRIINGEIYHDADNASGVSPLKINTSLGNIQHIGTRYLVNKTKNNLKVSVRNGLVEVNNNDIRKQMASGEQLSIDAFGNHHEINVEPYDSLWNWTQKAERPFRSKGKTLNDFVKWFAHENGYQIDWNSFENKTKRVYLTGDISNLNSLLQIKAIFLSTKFDYQINQGILSIHQ